MSQGMLEASRKDKETDCLSYSPLEGLQPCPHLDFNPVRPMSDL